jgi:hypothetical protein
MSPLPLRFFFALSPFNSPPKNDPKSFSKSQPSHQNPNTIPYLSILFHSNQTHIWRGYGEEAKRYHLKINFKFNILFTNNLSYYFNNPPI